MPIRDFQDIGFMEKLNFLCPFYTDFLVLVKGMGALMPGSSVPKTKLDRKENRRRRIKSYIPVYTTGLEKVEEVTRATRNINFREAAAQELLLARDGSTNHNPH